MQKVTLTLALLFTTFFASAQSLETVFEKSEGTQTPTYHEGIAYFQKLAETFPQIDIQEMGMTDSGYPLHLVIFNKEQEFDLQKIKEGKKAVLLINNAIHPGEPDGVDASMMLLRNLARERKLNAALDSAVIAVIPFYNIGGALNRNTGTRANQNGPEAYGFRGNAQNLDLNRDFVKMDSKNAFAFAEIFHALDPDVLVDTHVTNGTDHQHVLTLLSTQHNKLGAPLGKFLESDFEPALFEAMSNRDWSMVPYVNVHGKTPDEGWNQFYDLPRYASGYTTLFQSLGFTTETHMWKPFKQRVAATYDFLQSMLHTMAEQKVALQASRKSAREAIQQADELPINWELQKDEYKMITLKGYETSIEKSSVTGLDRLKYHRDQPYEKMVPFHNVYAETQLVDVPAFYIIPKGRPAVIERLKANNVKMHELKQDSTIEVEVYHIADYKTYNMPYEAHYPHYATQVKVSTEKIKFLKGTWMIPTEQKAKRYLVEQLEPESKDSFFNWNFFDTILQQKEHFSAYVFEEKAEALLTADDEMAAAFKTKQEQDSAFAASSYAQLDWIYQLSNHYETAHLRYPVYRYMKK